MQAAAAAFAEGQRAQLRGDHARAAEFFELADRTAPNAAAIRSAIRSHREAEHLARAATLALIARDRHPEDAETRALAAEVIAEATRALARVTVRCSPACSLAIDGHVVGARAAERSSLFLDPGTRALVASWPGRPEVRQELNVHAGGEREIELDAPPAPGPEPEPEPEPVVDLEPPAPQPEPASDGGGLSPALFAVGAGLTVITLGVAIGLGVATLDASEAYKRDPTRERYEAGVPLQWATTGLFIGAGVLGATTVIFAILTDWDGSPSSEQARITPWLAVDGEQALFGLSGRLELAGGAL